MVTAFSFCPSLSRSFMLSNWSVIMKISTIFLADLNMCFQNFVPRRLSWQLT